MGLLTQTQQQYYSGDRKSFTGDGTTLSFTIANSLGAFPSTYNSGNAKVFLDDVLQIPIDANGVINWRFNYTTATGWRILFTIAPANGVVILIDVDTNFGNYQFTSLDSIVNQFMIAYVGEDKVISKAKRTDVAFYAQRAIQELSFDTFKSCKSQEIEIPASLTMILPHDYVNYVKLTWSDSAGIEHIIYPARKTSNPSAIKQDADGHYSFDIDDDTVPQIGDRDDTTELIHDSNSDTWNNYKSATPSANQDDYQDDTYWPVAGGRYGLDPQHAQANGSFFIDCNTGKIHFSSNISGKTVILEYISDGLGTDEEMVVHKFAEEAMYKWIAYGVLSTRMGIPEYIINRYKKERFAETRKAKLRLSNIKLEELTQVLRGKSKQIKH
tara:strand:+ start:129 stop:1280 length:1152 start_codon:yes stop_codon:yes gene_type:complete